MSRQDGEDRRQEQKQGTVTTGPPASQPVAVSSDGSTVIRPKGVSRQDVPDTPAEPAMARIMQADGTMKMEIRYGNKKTI
jgi:hypothetical protein